MWWRINCAHHLVNFTSPILLRQTQFAHVRALLLPWLFLFNSLVYPLAQISPCRRLELSGYRNLSPSSDAPPANLFLPRRLLLSQSSMLRFSGRIWPEVLITIVKVLDTKKLLLNSWIANIPVSSCLHIHNLISVSLL